MADKCEIIIEGNLGRAPELQYLQSGTAVTNVSIANTRKDKKAAEGKLTDWFKIKAYDKTAEILAECAKGDKVQVEGRLERENYTKKDGTPVTDIVIKARRVVRLMRGSAAAGMETVELADDGE